jgi:hypothetical protein
MRTITTRSIISKRKKRKMEDLLKRTKMTIQVIRRNHLSLKALLTNIRKMEIIMVG